MPKITFFPLGNADCCQIDLDERQKLLFDYANMRCADDQDDKRIDLPVALLDGLNGNLSYDVVAFSHLDEDHICGASEFFYLEHAVKYQEEGRVKIVELWVPAAVIIEDGCTDEARVIQAEARYRFKKGQGIRIFSRPASLEGWLKEQGLLLSDRLHLITDAGQFVPNFTKEVEGVEFFVHSPFASRLADGTVMDRNTDSLVVQATFLVDGTETKLILGADIGYEAIEDIVSSTRYHGNEERLEWDIFKLPHHCSYKTLGPEKGKNKTEAVPDVKWLFEDQGQSRGTVISTSWPIPTNDEDIQPPHRQAAAFYRDAVAALGGRFFVTMEYPKESNPEPIIISIDKFKATIKMRSTVVGASVVAASAPRVG